MPNRLLALAGRVRREPDRAARLFVDQLKEPRPLLRGGLWINKLGLQLARTLKDRAAWHIRPFSTPEYIREHLAILRRDGVLMIENFLPDEDFARIEAELARIETWPADCFTVHELGTNMAVRQLSATFYADRLPALMRLLRDNSLIYDLARAIPRRRPSYKPRIVLHKLYKPDPAQPAGEHGLDRCLHTDRHYPFSKVFFCLEDMTREAAPYTYVPGSHLFDWERFRYEYRLSVEGARHRRDPKASEEVSWALSRELMQRRGLEERPLVAKKNTLIITDNAGLHRRNEMISGTRYTANLDFKFLESVAHPLYPVLKRWGSGGW